MSIDEDIIAKADKWNAADNAFKRKLADQKHDRLVAIGTFIKQALGLLALGSLVLGGGWYCNTSCEATKVKDAEVATQQREDNRKLDAVYDAAWVKCIENLGIEDCKLVGEKAIWECGSGNRYQSSCRAAMVQSRLEILAEAE